MAPRVTKTSMAAVGAWGVVSSVLVSAGVSEGEEVVGWEGNAHCVSARRWTAQMKRT